MDFTANFCEVGCMSNISMQERKIKKEITQKSDAEYKFETLSICIWLT